MPAWIDLTGQRFGKWVVLEYQGKSYWLCRCHCGKEGCVTGQSLREGRSKTCGGCKIIDIKGKRFGRLVTLEYQGCKNTSPHWLCRCDCGKEKSIGGGELRSGKTTSCGCGYLADQIALMTGKRFGRLTVISFSHSNRYGLHWLCKCDCGREKTIPNQRLRRSIKPTLSCGCLIGVNNPKRTHGLSRTRAYGSWRSMIERTSPRARPAAVRRAYYDRGISTCHRWRESDPAGFLNFLADMGQPPKGHTLDRINVDGNYEPGNCRWATHGEQVQNRRNMQPVLGTDPSPHVRYSLDNASNALRTHGDHATAEMVDAVRDWYGEQAGIREGLALNLNLFD